MKTAVGIKNKFDYVCDDYTPEILHSTAAKFENHLICSLHSLLLLQFCCGERDFYKKRVSD